MVNAEIPLIVKGGNGLWRYQGAEACCADGLHADRSKQTITRSALVIHVSKKHRNYQVMNAYFVRARRFMGRKVDIGCEINVLRIIRLRFFAGAFTEFQTPAN
jgi:hypothetical protein